MVFRRLSFRLITLGACDANLLRVGWITLFRPRFCKASGLAAKHAASSAVLGSMAVLLARVSRQHRFVIALPTAEQPVSDNQIWLDTV